MPSGFDATKKQRDGGDSQHVIQSRLRGTKSLSDLRAMVAESARINREKQLSESLRSTVEEYRRRGISRSTAPDLRNMTESQFLLEALSRPDWLNKLQEKSIEVNKTTLELISQKLKRVDPSDLRDYNTAVRNFNKTLYKLEEVEGMYFKALRVEPAGLEGGIFYRYNERFREYYGRIITLRDPEGTVHVFNRGEDHKDIARFTSRRISYYRNQYAKRWCSLDHSNQRFEYYKDQYTCQALTEDQVRRLREGDYVHGWGCTKIEYPTLPKEVYYTDMGTEIHALDLSNYQPPSRGEHERSYPPSRYRTIEDPTPTYNCHGHFIDRTAWLVPEKPGEPGESQIRKILHDNGYHTVPSEYAQVYDIVVYYKQDSSISHTALVVRIDGKIIVESKLGHFGLIQHDMYDSLGYGQPIIYRTTRGGHLLRTTRLMNPLS